MDLTQNNPAGNPAPEQGITAAPETENVTTAPEDQEPKNFTQEEVDKIVGERLAKERRKLQRETAQQAEQPVTIAVEPPNADKFKSAEEYLEALSDYKAELKVAQREQQKQRQALDSTFEDRADKAREKYDDFEQVAFKLPRDGGPAISEYMAQVIKESELGPDIAYHLGKNVEESKRIWGLSPLAQARELGKIEAALIANPPVKKVSSAPDPINPVRSRSNTPAADTTDPRSMKMPVSDWIAAENARRAKQGR